MRIFQVDEKNATIIESVLDVLSRPSKSEIESFVFGLTFEDDTYFIGDYNSSVQDMVKIASLITLEANWKYISNSIPKPFQMEYKEDFDEDKEDEDK